MGIGLVFMEGIWLYVMIASTILLYIVCGYFKKELDGGIGIVPACVLGTCATVFWPIILAAALAIGVVAMPVWVGKMLRKGMDMHIKKKKEKQKFINDIDKIKESRK
jgi:hypothetical protein